MIMLHWALGGIMRRKNCPCDMLGALYSERPALIRFGQQSRDAHMLYQGFEQFRNFYKNLICILQFLTSYEFFYFGRFSGVKTICCDDGQNVSCDLLQCLINCPSFKAGTVAVLTRPEISSRFCHSWFALECHVCRENGKPSFRNGMF